jgi:hypothetical protein
MVEISDALTTGLAGYTGELTAVAAIAVPILLSLWGAPKAVVFFKRLAK